MVTMNNSLQYPDAYIEYLVQFHGTRDYFECHEIMEAYWKSQEAGPMKFIWLGLIQLAVSLYHERRGNFPGAFKMIDAACRNLTEGGLEGIGIDAHRMQELLTGLRQKLEAALRGCASPYQDIEIPVKDPELLRMCREACDREGMVWLSPSPFNDDSVIHRHKLRDRTDVVEERRKSLEARKLGRQRGGISGQ